MNPVDHPHGGGEGPHLGRPSPGHPLGQAHQGPQDPQEQGDGQVHHPFAVTTAKAPLAVTRSVWKGPFVDGYLLKKAEAAPSRWPQAT